MKEIITDWVTPGTSEGATVMYWRETPVPVADQRAALAVFWQSLDDRMDNTTSWTIRTEGRLIDEATGTLTGGWSDSTVYTGTGLQAGQPLADATMALVRWNTTTIHEGRFIRGRTFVPGLASNQATEGNLDAGAVAAFTAAGETMLNTATGMGVWSRPRPGIAGLWAAAGSVATWSEFAVLRKRRG